MNQYVRTGALILAGGVVIFLFAGMAQVELYQINRSRSNRDRLDAMEKQMHAHGHGQDYADTGHKHQSMEQRLDALDSYREADIYAGTVFNNALLENYQRIREHETSHLDGVGGWY